MKLQGHRSLIGRRIFCGTLASVVAAFSCLVHKNASGRTTCPSDGPHLKVLSAGLRRAEAIFVGTFMLTHGGCARSAALSQKILLAL